MSRIIVFFISQIKIYWLNVSFSFLFPFHIKIKGTYVVDKGTSSILFEGGVSDNITDCFTLDYCW
jgi:hypothetical protein